MRHRLDLHALDASDLFDLLDVELEDYLVRNGEVDGGLDKLRAALSNGYDETYHPLDQLYGSNDTTPPPLPATRVGPDGADDPLGASAAPPRPYLPPTEQGDTGYAGLMPPVG